MGLPTEFLTMETAGTLAMMGAVLFILVQATKELGFVKRIPTLLYAIILATLLLFVGTIARAVPRTGAEWAQALFLSVVNGIITAGTAVLTHQAGLATGILTAGRLGEPTTPTT